MAEYAFVTVWTIDAPIERVWQAIYDIEKWPEWWSGVKRVTKLATGEPSGVGNHWQFTYRSKLPYDLNFEIKTSKVEPPHLSEGLSTGELEGVGRWRLSQEGAVTTVRYEWSVQTTKLWMNLLAPLMRPVFSWNHNISMQGCSEGMARYLGTRLISPAAHLSPAIPASAQA
jgi:uncharacterized protein YndB with AHSA1/START domain